MPLNLRSAFGALATAAAIVSTLGAMQAKAAVVVFENLPTTVSTNVPETESHHGVGGPILADDFVPATGGLIKKVEWWGSQAIDNRWELAFHTNNPALNQPNIDDPFEGGLVKYGELGDIVANGSQDVVAHPELAGHPELWHFSVDLPVLLGVNGGQNYWFTVANFSAGWHWAYALGGTTVGAENHNAHQSTGIGLCGDGGPHCGPWTDVHTDFAFRLTALPEPGSIALAGLALGILGVVRRPRHAA